MGFTSDITNKINGKKYLISTTLVEKKSGIWETAVLQRMLLGIPNMLCPLIRIGARNELQAQLAHRRTKEIVEQLNPTDWNSAKLALVNDDEYVCAAEHQPWEYFRGKPNTNTVLEEKARVVSELITMASNTSVELASALIDNKPELRLGDEEARQALAETIVFLISVVDRLAIQFLDSEKRDTFMQILTINLAKVLKEKGVNLDFFQKLLDKRHEEYSYYQEWIPKENEAAKGTLFWEFAKKITVASNISPNALFNVALTNALLKDILDWKLNDLLFEHT